jgi:hypothetical protein
MGFEIRQEAEIKPQVCYVDHRDKVALIMLLFPPIYLIRRIFPIESGKWGRMEITVSFRA